jgi:hypothetical protein
MAGVTASTTDGACNVCLAEPTRINSVTASLALHVIPHPRPDDKKYLVGLLKRVEPQGPGTELRKILTSVGIKEPADCDCRSYANLMDKWGSEECNRRKQEIIIHLNAQAITWLDMLKVAVAGYLTTDALLTEAIKRSCKSKVPP